MDPHTKGLDFIPWRHQDGVYRVPLYQFRDYYTENGGYMSISAASPGYEKYFTGAFHHTLWVRKDKAPLSVWIGSNGLHKKQNMPLPIRARI